MSKQVKRGNLGCYNCFTESDIKNLDFLKREAFLHKWPITKKIIKDKKISYICYDGNWFYFQYLK